MLLRGIRQRISGVAGAGIAAVFIFICGAIMAFVISPQQAVEWRRIQNLPELDAGGVAAAAAGEKLAVTGILEDNPTLNDEGLVLYRHERWEVTPPDPTDSEDTTPDGSWKLVEQNIPVLAIQISGGSISTLPDDSAMLGGQMHEWLTEGPGPLEASTGGQQLPDGSERIQGFRNGDLVTITGQKASTGGIVPDRIFGGDRVQLVEDIRGQARAALIMGVGMMICAPIVLVIGVVASIFGRNR